MYIFLLYRTGRSKTGSGASTYQLPDHINESTALRTGENIKEHVMNCYRKALQANNSASLPRATFNTVIATALDEAKKMVENAVSEKCAEKNAVSEKCAKKHDETAVQEVPKV